MVQFNYKKKSRETVPNCDVKIAIRKANKQRNESVEVTFYNYSWKRIVGDGDYIVCGTLDGKMFFKKETKANGYKLYKPTASYEGVRCFKCVCDNLQAVKSHGYLEFDETEQLYFVRMK